MNRKLIELTPQQIKVIAEDIDSGFQCFYNFRTKEAKSFVKPHELFSSDYYIVDGDLKEIEDNPENYYEFRTVSSRDIYIFMEEFAVHVSDEDLQDKLLDALNMPKPFRNFKSELEEYDVFYDQWQEFKNKKIMKHLEKQIEEINLALVEAR
ncbi:UPF0158 family protein [Cytophagaceae bacterium ABcell3]|nr:UPF0158 family protein [Cytophagaceae bacterium ABcell3]